MHHGTIYQLIFEQIHQIRDSIAIYAPSRSPLTYDKLLIQINQTVNALGTMGIGRGDRVALVLPDGPEMVVAFLAVSSCAVSAPLNSAYLKPEFTNYFNILHIKALIVQAGIDSPARTAAQALSIPVIELVFGSDADAGCFILQ